MKTIITNFAAPDPYIFEHENKYYIYATGQNGVVLFCSDDLVSWEERGIVFSIQGQKEYWAPCVIKVQGMFYMYVSSMPCGSEDHHTQHICVACSSTPDGVFQYKGDLIPPFSIDPHVVERNGQLYMFYSVNDYNAEKAGTYIVVDKMLSPLQMQNNPKSVLRPSLEEEMFEANRFRQGQDWYTLEGAFYFYDSGVHYLMYSGSAFTKPSYFIGYATATAQVDDLTKLEFTKYPSSTTFMPLLSKTDILQGMGHNSVLKKDGEYYICYHARLSEHGERVFCISKMQIIDKKLKVLL